MRQPPNTLSAITLSQWIGYQNTYGQELDNRLMEIAHMAAGEDRNNDYLLYDMDYHQQNYAYYTGTPLYEVQKMNVTELIKLQGAAFIAMKKEEVLLNWNSTFDWLNDRWQIQPVFPAADKLNKQQYDIITDIALVFSDLQDGKHEALYELCAIYLRKPGEVYTGELLDQRKELMKDLPLSIALCVKKYIDITVKKTFRK